MYENQSFGIILTRMLDRVPSDLDKREGSIIYDALSPAAFELAEMYVELDAVLSLGFGETTSGGYLDLRASDRGVERKQASKAKRHGIFYTTNEAMFDIPIGSRYAISAMNYVVKERISLGHFELEAEKPGIIGNQNFGPLLPLDYIEGLVRAEIADILIPGTDTETDEELRIRYLQKVREPATSGNASHYKQWATEVVGVGAAKVTPLWNGPGTVKLTIVDVNRLPTTPTLVSEVAEHIETVGPIGANVTVVSAEGLAININATVTLATGYGLFGVQEAFIASVNDFIRLTAFELTFVSYARIGTLLLGTLGIIDHTGLTVNGGTSNIAVPDDKVPVLGSVSLGV